MLNLSCKISTMLGELWYKVYPQYSTTLGQAPPPPPSRTLRDGRRVNGRRSSNGQSKGNIHPPIHPSTHSSTPRSQRARCREGKWEMRDACACVWERVCKSVSLSVLRCRCGGGGGGGGWWFFSPRPPFSGDPLQPNFSVVILRMSYLTLPSPHPLCRENSHPTDHPAVFLSSDVDQHLAMRVSFRAVPWISAGDEFLSLLSQPLILPSLAFSWALLYPWRSLWRRHRRFPLQPCPCSWVVGRSFHAAEVVDLQLHPQRSSITVMSSLLLTARRLLLAEGTG